MPSSEEQLLFLQAEQTLMLEAHAGKIVDDDDTVYLRSFAGEEEKVSDAHYGPQNVPLRISSRPGLDLTCGYT